MAKFDNDESGYREWIKTHPLGFVLVSWNPPRPEYISIHRADCYTINPEKAKHKDNWTKSYIKVCGNTVEELTEWVEEKWKQNAQIHLCGHCKKAGRL